MPHSTFSSANARLIALGLRHMGFEAEPVLERAGLDPQTLKDPDARIPGERMWQLWQLAVDTTGDEDFGIHLSEFTPAGLFGAVEYVTRNCATCGDALESLARYSRIIHDGGRIEVIREGAQARIVHTSPGDPIGPHRANAEWLVGRWLVAGRELTGVDWRPTAVSFRHPRPDDVTEHARTYGRVPTFDAPATELVLAAEVLRLPIPTADPTLNSVLRRFVDKQLDSLPKADAFDPQLERVLGTLICNGPPRLQEVAQKLAMSPRTLQRRLHDGGTSFKEAVDASRRRLAAHYLAQPDLAIGEIAFLLGYSEPSAFNRSFKRWHGTTPRAFRARAS